MRLRHPDLPEDQTITVPDQAAQHHRAAGWELVDGPDPESTRSAFADAKAAAEKTDTKPSPAPVPAADAAPESAPDTAPRRRATKEAEKQ